jgi:diguanylate cyclase (GGDEF)-like protein
MFDLARLWYSGFGVKAALYLASVFGRWSSAWTAVRRLALGLLVRAGGLTAALRRRIAHFGFNRALTYLLTALLFLTLIGSGIGIMNRTWRQILEGQAQANALSLAEHITRHVPDIASIAAGDAPIPASADFLHHAQNDDGVLAMRIFDTSGHRHFGPDLPPEHAGELDDLRPPASVLPALEAGRIELRGENETTAGAPVYHVHAYLPILREQRLVGIADVLIDMTSSYNATLNTLLGATLSFGLILAIAFGVPGIGFWLRTRQKELAETKLDFLSQHDALTSLPNRASLMRRLAGLLPADQGPPKAITVLSLGLDHFKEINSALGHEAGDQLLRDVADRLSGALQPGEFVARAGGDEFVVVKDCTTGCVTQADCATELAQRLIKGFARTFLIREAATRISPSIGIASCPDDGIDPETLVKNANLALQAAKADARGSFTFYEGAMDEQSQRRRCVARQVRVACDSDGFLLNYQPVYSLGTGLLSGFEALVRLPQADGSMVSPAEFIPAAEDLGLITKIGTWVLETACQQAAHWPDDLTIAINISPAEFREGRVVERVAAALAKSGLKPERLEIEVTEGVMLADTATTRRTMDGLKKLGVAIVLDDFGTGYSSLSYLWQFRFDKLKIDQSFVRAIGKGNNVTDIIRTIVALGRALDLRVTAEGVETEAQAAVLKAMRCDLVQGYLYGVPVALPDVPAYMAKPLPGSLADKSAAAQPVTLDALVAF